MVSSPHEALHRIFQKDPSLLTRTLQRVLHVPFPEPREFAAMNVDLLVGWDWHAVMHESVPALRERYGITGVTIVEIPPPAANDAHTHQA